MLKVAVIIPCFNEEASVGAVINGFRATLPNSDIYVYDNGSTDNSVKVARKRIVHVSHVARREKGNVVRQAFADVEADVYIMVDGDDTYDPTTAPVLVNEVMHNQCDMVTVCRIRGETSARALPGHLAGNALFSRLVRRGGTGPAGAAGVHGRAPGVAGRAHAGRRHVPGLVVAGRALVRSPAVASGRAAVVGTAAPRARSGPESTVMTRLRPIALELK